MTAVAVVALAIGACIGGGAAVLRLLNLLDPLAPRERAAWSFAVGFGLLGWLLFPMAVAGWLGTSALLALLCFCATGVFVLPANSLVPTDFEPVDRAALLPLAALLVVFVFDFIGALAPPVDADSLAYHFALPKQFLAVGHLEFIPRAVDGAVPLLGQMTYLPVMALGGEQALTLWVMASGWAVVALVYVLSRRWLNPTWSLATAVIFATTPAVLYGAGSGQVEVRLALFVLVAVFAMAEAVAKENLRLAILAGLAAGFYGGGKYTGLFLVLACGLALLLRKGWFARGAAFGVTAMVAGFQWYLWNWIHTGDPVFPMMFDRLALPDTSLWNQLHQQLFTTTFFGSEQAIPTTPASAFLYPFLATFAPEEAFESSRTGFGPFPFLVLPWAIYGVWQKRQALRANPLSVIAVVLFLFYLLWFFTGSSQRIRHLLPIYPPLLIILMIAAERGLRAGLAPRPFFAAVAATILLQLGGAGLFTLPAIRHIATGESREAYYERMIPSYGVAKWLNQHLSATDRVMHMQRQINYMLDVPYLYTDGVNVAAVDLLPDIADPTTLWKQLQNQNITYVALGPPLDDPSAEGTPSILFRTLAERGCLTVDAQLNNVDIQSRTLPAMGQTTSRIVMMHLTKDTCRL